MKKIFATLLVLLLTAAIFSACAVEDAGTILQSDSTAAVTLPSTTEVVLTASTANTKTVEIDGVRYRNNFQGDLVLSNLEYDHEPLFVDGSDRYFRLDCAQYELLFNRNTREASLGDSIYCRDDQWQKLHAYYSNLNNFTFGCLVFEPNADAVFYPIPNMDPTKLDALCKFEQDCNDILRPFKKGSIQTRKVSPSILQEPELRFGKNSNDGLFTAGAAKFYIWEGKLVWYSRSVGDEYVMVADVPKDLSQYFIALTENLEKPAPLPEPSTKLDWSNMPGIRDHGTPLRSAPLLLAEVKKQAAFASISVDTRQIYIPDVLKQSSANPVSVLLRENEAAPEDEAKYCLEYFSQGSVVSTATLLRYAPFLVQVTIFSESQYPERIRIMEDAGMQRYQFADSKLYLATQLQTEGTLAFDLICYRQSTGAFLLVKGYLNTPYASGDVLAKKLYQDFTCVPLA